jgi:hypothetical protein
MNYAHGYLFHFLMSLTQKRNYAHGYVSFFNELDTEMNYAQTLTMASKRSSSEMEEQCSGRNTCQETQ